MTTVRTIRLHDGSELTYQAKVDEIVADSPDGRPGARYVFTQYLRQDVDEQERASRPLLFVFNGGPGSSSVWTHFGLGPRRVAQADALQPTMAPPFSLDDNPDTPLATADLVFIDPPGTGYSRLLESASTADFYGLNQDAAATLQFVARWIRRNRREQSPRFVAGESYGTLRASRMAKLAVGGAFRGGITRGTALNGIIVFGPAFDMGELSFAGDVRIALEFPTLVRTAREHGTTSAETDGELSQFARERLLPALAAGETLPRAERDALAERMSDLIGVSADEIAARGLRIPLDEFARIAVKDRHLGMYDSRFSLPADGAGDDPVADDPGMGQYMPQFTGVIESYLRDELGYETEDEYRSIDFRITLEEWEYDGSKRPQTGSFADLVEVLRRDRRFEVLIAAGEFDFVTTRAANEYALARYRYDASRVHLNTYPAGHMPYLGSTPRARLSADIQDFIGRLSRE